MNDENDEFVNTEEPLEVSDELLKELMEASAQIDRGEFISHEEMQEYIQQLIKELDEDLPLTKDPLATNKEHKIRAINEL